MNIEIETRANSTPLDENTLDQDRRTDTQNITNPAAVDDFQQARLNQSPPEEEELEDEPEEEDESDTADRPYLDLAEELKRLSGDDVTIRYEDWVNMKDYGDFRRDFTFLIRRGDVTDADMRIVRTIAAVLHATGSAPAPVGDETRPVPPVPGPLRFYGRQTIYAPGEEQDEFLLCMEPISLTKDPSLDDVADQIHALIDYLRNPENCPEVDENYAALF